MTFLIKVFDPLFIFATIAIAFFGSYTCITLYEQYRVCSKENTPKLLNPITLLLCMAISLGGVGIWTMHFVAMAGMKFYTPDNLGRKRVQIEFQLYLTIISLLAVIVCSFCGLFFCSRDKTFILDKSDVVDKYVETLRTKTITEIRNIESKRKLMAKSLFRNMIHLLLGGMFIAGGVCVMHYIGMQAIVFEGHIEWDIGIVFSSVIIAIIASSAALWILFRLLALFPEIELLRTGSALVMALAVNGVHYTGMAAGNFVYEKDKRFNSSTAIVDSSEAALDSVIASIIFLLLMLIVSIADLRIWYYHLVSVIKEADTKAQRHFQEKRTQPQPFLKEYRALRNCESTFHTGPKKIMSIETNKPIQVRVSQMQKSKQSIQGAVTFGMKSHHSSHVRESRKGSIVPFHAPV